MHNLCSKCWEICQTTLYMLERKDKPSVKKVSLANTYKPPREDTSLIVFHSFSYGKHRHTEANQPL